MKLMLSALKKEAGQWGAGHDDLNKRAISAGEQAIAEAEKQSQCTRVECMGSNGCINLCWQKNTTPPQRKPLTDEQIWKFWWDRPVVLEGEDDSMEAQFVAAVRSVLNANGIKE